MHIFLFIFGPSEHKNTKLFLLVEMIPMLYHTALCRNGLSTYSTKMRLCTSVYVHMIFNCRLSSKPSATMRAFELMRSLIRAFACSLEYFRILKLLTKQHLESLSLKGGCTSLRMSKCHIVGNLMLQLIYKASTSYDQRAPECVLPSEYKL